MSHVLIIEDDRDAGEMMALWIGTQGFSVSVARSLREARAQMALRMPDLMLLDLHLPDGSGLTLLRGESGAPPCDVVLITGHATLDTSIEALRLGAVDYLIKPVSESQLRGVLSRITRPGAMQAEITGLQTEWQRTGSFGHLVGKSAAMSRVYQQIARVAGTAITVLIAGESGTGKELVARTVHDLSRRRAGPFLAVNCGAISPQLIESEIFGHEKGSFTGADRQHQGFFERAEGGTLFLDEVTEMPLSLQVKLLRILETRSYMRVGSTRVLETDVRIVAATNRDPEQAVRSGALREDLFYRLNVFPVELPPLRERPEDVPLLAQHFLEDVARREGHTRVFTPAALRALQAYPWPGNVRELRNAVQRAYVMAEGEEVTGEWIPAAAGHPADAGTGADGAQGGAGDGIRVPVGTSLAETERKLILATLGHFQNHKERTAAALGVSLKTLYNRLKEYEGTPATNVPH